MLVYSHIMTGHVLGKLDFTSQRSTMAFNCNYKPANWPWFTVFGDMNSQTHCQVKIQQTMTWFIITYKPGQWALAVATQKQTQHWPVHQIAWNWSRSPGGSSCRSVNSCDVTGTSCIGSCLSSGLFQWYGEGGFAAWVTAYSPYSTQASERTPQLCIQYRNNKETSS